MILVIGIFLFVIGCALEASGKDWEQSERNKERRHRELMATKKNQKKVTHRRMMRDEHGRFMAEEIVIEGIEDE